MTADAYLSRGVSPTKDDVKGAIKNQTKGVFPGAFCKVIEDIAGDNDYCSSIHADGAGTKSVLAYLYYKETGDKSWFRGIAQDSTVMNIDDLLCIGAYDKFVLSNTIGRNAHRIDGEILKQVIGGYEEFAEKMASYGIKIEMAGGETADVGDLVSTIIVDSTVFVRLKKDRVITNDNIRPGDVIVGLSSHGKAVYEDRYNSGIASNGLTAARHSLLSSYYRDNFPESFSNTIELSKVYCGSYRMTDKLPGTDMTAGEAILSPTRTYAPVVKEILENSFDKIHGMIHCTGGGQGKSKSFGNNLHYIKDSLMEIPQLFKIIEKEGKIPRREMYQIFNMGHRLEFYLEEKDAAGIIKTSEKYGIEAKIIGRVEESAEGNKVTVKDSDGEYVY